MITITPPPRSITEYPLRSVTIVAKHRDDPLWVVLDAVIERQRVCEDITRMAYTLIGRATYCDDATRARIQRRLSTLVRDTQPEVE